MSCRLIFRIREILVHGYTEMEIVIDQLCDINTAENTWRGTHGLTVLRQQPAGHSLRQASLLISPRPVEHMM